MEFRPCIDIHNGQVKQIVGGTLSDEAGASENFSAAYPSSHYAKLYQKDNLKGGHVIMLNAKDSPYYEKTRQSALEALSAYPGGLQIGGGINADNAKEYLEVGASHIIVTSYVFKDGEICYTNLNELVNSVGREHIVLDLSCRRREDSYYIVTDRWQKFTDTILTRDLLNSLSKCCDEFLVHAVDVEGRVNGIEEDVVSLLAECPIPVTYAGGVSSLDDIRRIRDLGRNNVAVTIGSALSIFGGELDYKEVVSCIQSW